MRKGKNRPYIHSFWGSNPFGLLTWNKRRKMALKKVVATVFEGQRNITSIKLQMARNLSVDARGRAKRSCPWNMQKVPRGFIPKHTKAARIWAVAQARPVVVLTTDASSSGKKFASCLAITFLRPSKILNDLELEKSLVHRARLSFEGNERSLSLIFSEFWTQFEAVKLSRGFLFEGRKVLLFT